MHKMGGTLAGGGSLVGWLVDGDLYECDSMEAVP